MRCEELESILHGMKFSSIQRNTLTMLLLLLEKIEVLCNILSFYEDTDFRKNHFGNGEPMVVLSSFKSIFNHVCGGAQWLSGRVLDSRPKGRGFEPHRRHCVVVLEQDTFILA